MTGLRPATSGVYGNNDVWRAALPEATTLPQHLMRNGYETLGAGKVFHGPRNDAASWQRFYSFEGFVHPEEKPAAGAPPEHVRNSVETRGSPELVVYAAWA